MRCYTGTAGICTEFCNQYKVNKCVGRMHLEDYYISNCQRVKVFAGVSCVILVSIKREGLEVNLNLPHLALLEYTERWLRQRRLSMQQIEIYLPILL